MIINKTLGFILILQIFIISSLFSGNLPVLIFTPLVKGEEISKGDTGNYNEIFRGYLINNSRISLIDDIGVSREGEVLSLQSAISLGRRKQADFVLYGVLSRDGSDIQIFVTLLDPVSEQNILAENMITSREYIEADLETLSEQIVQQISISSQDSIEYLKAYYESGNWERAWEIYIEISRNSESRNSEIQEYGRVIIDNLSMKFFRDAELLLESGSFDAARASISKAIELKPGTKDYESLKSKIEEDFSRYREDEKNIVLKTLNELIRSEQYRSADVILLKLEDAGFSTDADVVVVRNRVRQGLEELDFYTAARNAYKNHDYIEARLQLNNAMTINSIKAEYIELQMRINEREAQEIRNQRTWDKYSSDLTSFDPFLLFIQVKEPEWFLTVSYNSNKLVYSVTGTVLEEESIDMQGVELTFSRFLPPFLDFMVLDSDLFGLKPTLIGDISLCTGVEKSSISATGIRSTGGSTAYIGGTAGVSLTAFAFTFGGGITLQTGTFVKIDKDVFPYDESSNTSSLLWDYTLGIGLDLWFSWYPFEGVQIITRYRTIKTGLWGQDTSFTDPSNRIFSIGIGTRLF